MEAEKDLGLENMLGGPWHELTQGQRNTMQWGRFFVLSWFNATLKYSTTIIAKKKQNEQ